MKRNAVTKVTARLAAKVLAALALLFALPAMAADRALINMIGYSEDGTYFAFEQFGIQDGSGFAFSSVYVVDLVHDKWTYGTPFEVQAEDENKSLAEVRLAALGKAQDKFDEYKIGVPVQVLALNGDGAASESATRLSWSTPACCGPGVTQTDAFDLVIATRGIASTEDYCKDMSPVGFTLTYQDQNGARELHGDGDTLPKSRGCTLDYRLYAVVQPFENHYADGFVARRVAIVATYPFGFEGVDRRFLVVPIDK
jgi:predicted secreted protein